MSSSTLKQENDKLKKQLSLVKKSTDFYKKQIDELQKQMNTLQNQLQQHKQKQKSKSPHSSQSNPKPINITKPISPPNNKQNIVTSVSRNDAANALAGLFGSKKNTIKSPIKPKTNNIVSSVNRNDATNALAGLFGKKTPIKSKSPSPSPSPISPSNNKSKLKKYEIMLKVGVDLSGVLTQMKKDNLSKDLIDIFNKSHGGSDLEEKEETDPIKLGLPHKPSINITKGISMKRLHWEPLSLTSIKDSMWYKCNQEWMDYKAVTFELKFQTRKQKPKISKDALKCGVNAADNDEKKSAQKVEFVSAKRSQQVQIGLKSYHMTNEQLREMILKLDDTKLDINSLIALIDIIPTPEEQLAAERASEDHKVKYFGISERFFYSLYDIIEITPRCKKWLFMLQFEAKASRLEEMITLMEKSKIAITRSQNLRDIFSILLAFGNHMNAGNKLRGNCYGFHLNCLSLLPQIKTFDNAMTFPMFLYDFINKKDSKLLDIIKQFKVIGQAQNITGETIDKAYDELLNEVKDLNLMINRYNDEYFETLCIEDKFLVKMNKFEIIAKKRMWKLKFKYDGFHKCEKQLIKYFAYNTEEEAVSINKILKDIYMFIEMLSSAKIKLNILEKQRKKKALRKKKNSNKRVRRKSDEDILKKMGKRGSVKPRTSKRFAIGLDDIGTPLAEQQSKNMTFTQMIMKSPGLNDSKLSVIIDVNTMSNNIRTSPKKRYKTPTKLTPKSIHTKPKPKYKPPHVNVAAKLGTIHVRRNSDPGTPNNNSSRKFNLNKNKFNIVPKGNKNKFNIKPKGDNLKIKTDSGINLMSSHSKLTPSGEKSHANVDIGLDINKNKKTSTYTGRHGYLKKANSDITAMIQPQNRQLKNRKKIPPKRPIPSKKLPMQPQNPKKWRKKNTTNV